MAGGFGERVRRSLPALLVFGLLPFLCAPGLLWGEWFWFRDAWQTLAPWKLRAGEALLRGELPLWTAAGGAGLPLLGNPSAGAAYPLNALIGLLPAGWGLAIVSALHLSIAGLGARALARAMGAGAGGGWVAGVAYAVSGPVVSHLSTFSHGVACAWIPVAILGAVHLARGPRWGWGAVGAAALALIVVGGEAQLALYTAAAMAMAVVGAAAPGERVRAAGRLAAVAPLAFCLAAVQILPTAEWLGQVGVPDPAGPPGAVLAGRVHDWAFAVRTSWRPDVAVMEWLVPGVFGHQTSACWGAAHGIAERYVTSIWMGVIVSVLAVLGWRRRAARTTAGWAAAGLWLALGAYGGLYWLCYQGVPGFASFRFPDKALPFAALGVAVAAGFGWRAWTAEVPDAVRARRERWLFGAAAVWVVIAVVTAVAGPVWSVPGVLDDPVTAAAAPWSGPAWRAAAIAAVAGVVLWLAGRDRLGSLRLALVCGCIAVSGAWVNHAASPTRPAADYTAPSPAAAVFGEASPLEWRLLSVQGRDHTRGITADAAAWHLRERRRYRAYGAWFEDRATIGVWETSMLRGYAAMVVGANDFGWLGALGVRDIAADDPLPDDPALELLGRTEQSYCYRNRLALPRARLVGAVEPVADDRALRARVTTDGFPHAERVCLRAADLAAHAAALATLDPAAAAAGSARIVQDSGNALAIRTDAPGPALCVVADLLYPGWEAAVDGEPAVLLPVNGAFRGVVVPAGAHVVTMRLSNGAASLGFWLTLLGWCAVAACCRRWGLPPGGGGIPVGIP